jgi:hypothetical protein
MRTSFRPLSAGLVSLAVLALSLSSGASVLAAGPSVGLGAADGFTVLAGAGITNTGTTVIKGDTGSSPTSSETGFGSVVLTGTNHTAPNPNDTVTQNAKASLTTAYVDAAGRTPTTAVSGGVLGGQTLVAGVYNSAGSIFDLTGVLTLDGQNDPASVWIFQASSSLITASSSRVAFINGGSPCNVFWQVTSSATLGTGSVLAGSVLALTSITVNSGVTVHGRVLARNGTVTLDSDTIDASSCITAPASSPSASPASSASASPASSPSASPASSASASPASSASATPSTAGATATPRASHPAQPGTSAAGFDGPSGSTALLAAFVLLLLSAAALRFGPALARRAPRS